MSSGQACAPASSIDSSRKAKRHCRSALKRLVYQQCAALWVSWTTGCEKLAILAAGERHDNDQRDELAKEQKENLQKQAAALDREIAQVSTQIPATAAYADTLKQLADRLEPMAAKSNIAHMDFEVRRESYMATTLLENPRRETIQLQARWQTRTAQDGRTAGVYRYRPQH
jgi:hypothetical protein